MITRYSILHISDLHKGERNNFKNLFASLRNDSDSYELNIPKPEIIVVSGDLADGAEGDDAEQIIIQQYQEVELFLNDLVDHFLQGDKRKIIIVPGNHDLYRGATKKSMDVVDDKLRDMARDCYLKGSENYRWNWKDYNFYCIQRSDVYASRFKFFVEFYNRFYDGIRMINDCDTLNDVIDLPEYNLTFAIFNSCHKIDHLNQIGAISTDALVGTQRELSKMFKYGRFIVGVWHHNISGIPTQSNYLDPRILHSLSDFHIQVGLYGHQHHAEVLYEYRDVFKQGRMSLISSGCLYGSGRTMPAGTHCQYNIIEIDQKRDENKVNLTLHVREDETGWDIPSWRKKLIDGKDSFLMTFDLPKPDYKKMLADIVDIAKSKGRYEEALLLLVDIREKIPVANKFIDEFLKELSGKQILNIDINPETESQAISILGACIEEHDWEKFDKIIDLCEMVGIKSQMIRSLIEDSIKIR